MKTSTTLLIAAGAVVAVVGIGSKVYADSSWRGRGPCGDDMRREDGRGWGDRSMRGPKSGMMGGRGMHGPMGNGPGQGFARGPMGGPMGGPGFMGGHGPMGGMMGPMVMKRVFELADTNEDGKLTREEIDAARKARFEKHDANGDGKLSLDEFKVLFAEITEPATVRVFQFLDPDGDAEITMEEFSKPADRMVTMFDRNGDGVLSPEDRGRGPGANFERGPMRDGSGPHGPKAPKAPKTDNN